MKILNLTLISTLFLLTSINTFAIDSMLNYQSSNIEDSNLLEEMFRNLNRNKKRFGTTQCFNRAHYWSYQLQQDYGVNTQKVFIYFTRKFTREINGDWWFHVAPAMYLNDELYVLDPEFLSKPVKFEAWKNGAIDHAIRLLTPLKIKYENEIASLNKELPILGDGRRHRRRKNYINSRLNWLKSELKRRLIDKAEIVEVNKDNWPYDDNRKQIIKLDCPIISNYSEYAKLENAHKNAYCYIQMANMYVWEPGELEELEYLDENKIEFDIREVFTAFKDTFKGRFPYPMN
jgi:hypothetical protein